MSTLALTPTDERDVCDCHVHVIGPMQRYRLVDKRSYTPMPATAEDLIEMMQRCSVGRAVIVQPSVLGQDNTCTIDAMATIAQAGRQARAVAVLEHAVAPSQLDQWHRQGVRGLRVNLQSHASGDLSLARQALQLAASQCERNGWHVQLYVDRQTLYQLSEVIQALAVPVVLDHFAGLSADEPPDAAANYVFELLATGEAWIKLSGNYRITTDPLDPALGDLARQLAAINPDHLVWASDWPHTPSHSGQATVNPPVTPYRDIDTCALSEQVQHWLAPATAKQVLCDNPARLYGF